jgi:hypothetical protein
LKFKEILICEDISLLCHIDRFAKILQLFTGCAWLVFIKTPHPLLYTGDAEWRRLTFKMFMNFMKFYFSEHHVRRTPDMNRISARDQQR